MVIERDVAPRGHYVMPAGGRDGVLRRRGAVLERLLHPGGDPVVVRAWPAGGAVRLHAEGPTREAAETGLERMRFALGVDHDLRPFHRAFRRDPLIGPVIWRRPWLRPRRRPEPFEALAWAICEQLIDSGSAEVIERRLVRRYGRPSHCGRLRDAPSPRALADRAPAELCACGLAPNRSIAMVRASREVAAGRADLGQHEAAWRRLRKIPEIGSWTLEKLAFAGQGRDDQLPAGDLAFVKLVARLEGMDRRATEEEVREYFAPYGEHAGLAGLYALWSRR